MICHIIIGLNVGGAELMLRRLISSLKISNPAQRHILISMTTMGTVGQLLKASGTDVYELNIQSCRNVLPGLWKMYTLLRTTKPDIIQTWMYHADLFGGIVGRLAGCKNIIWGIRTTDISKNGSNTTFFIRWLCARLSKYIPRIILCVADKARHEHVKHGYYAEKMRVIQNGFDTANLQASLKEVSTFKLSCGIHSNHIVVGNLARFNPSKDPYNFIQAACLIAAQIPQARFLMVGRGCDHNNHQLTTWIKSMGLSENFILLGERKDTPVCLSAMDVFCMPSFTEGFPNALGEAMYMRKLCVATDVGDASFLLGDCGMIVPKQDSQALADGVMKLLALSVDEKEDLSTRAHARIASEFTMDIICLRFEALYIQLLNTHK